MSTDINKGRIGAFVSGAIIFLIMTILLLGKDSFFNNDTKFILFFHGSISGLNVGAPVVFRGVPLGRVTKISLWASENNQEISIPVIVKINESNIFQDSDEALAPNDNESSKDILQRMINNGLRARLEMGSLLTGKSRVELDFFPNTKPHYVGRTDIPEIPTIDSTKELFIRKLEDLPLGEIATNLLSSLKGISDIVNNPKTIEAMNSLNDTLLASKKLFERLDLVSIEVKKLVNTTNISANILKKELPSILKNFNVATTNLSLTLKQIEHTLIKTESVISPNSVTIRNFNKAIKEVEKASRGISEFANMLKRNPESLLLGKGANR